MGRKPVIIVLSGDEEDEFRWVSDGWFQMSVRHTEQARMLWDRAKKAMEDGENVPDVIRRLEEVGFEVRRRTHD